MINKEEFDFFIEQLTENALKEFRETEHHYLLREKLEWMDRDCDVKLAEDERDFAGECFELISEINGIQERYVYNKAFKDCVNLLKNLGILA